MKLSLRTLLAGLWLLFVVVCLALAFLMKGLFQFGVDAQVKHVRAEVERSAGSVVQRFAVYLTSFDKPPRVFADEQRKRELNLILDLVLAEYRGVEGGFWTNDGGFVAYGFPTYDGTTVKKDVPEAEKARILQVIRAAEEKGSPQTQIFGGESARLILCARPAGVPGLTVWTMARAHVEMAEASEQLAAGCTALFVFAALSGVAMLWFLQKWSGRVAALERTIATAPVEELPALAETGLRELDIVVAALNQLAGRLRQAREQSGRLSAELARAERLAALGRMAAGIAHEIRNPIAAIRLRAENALVKGDENRIAALQFALQEVRRLEDLLERLLAMTRVDRLKLTEVALEPWLRGRAARFQAEIEARGVRLETGNSVASWVFDEDAMSRAIENLLLNALQHTPPGGWVRLTAEPGESSLLLFVEDSGEGVPEEKREHIFEPFVTGRTDGSGLGLSISRQIVEAHGGTIRCAAGEGGARFEIELPCKRS